MKKIIRLSLISLLLFMTSWISFEHFNKLNKHVEKGEAEGEDYFFLSHGFPYYKIDYDAQKKAAKLFRSPGSSLRTTQTSTWEFAGPVNIGGRIVDIEFNPLDQKVAYIAAASGGI